MKVDMSPEAVTRRLDSMGELWELSVALMDSRRVDVSEAADRISSLVVKFRQAATEKGNFAIPAKLDHRSYRSMRESYLGLRSMGASGRNAMLSLLLDECVYVRTWIAAALLVEGNTAARKTLEEIAEIKGGVGFDARITLQEFEAGRLKTPFPAKGR